MPSEGSERPFFAASSGFPLNADVGNLFRRAMRTRCTRILQNTRRGASALKNWPRIVIYDELGKKRKNVVSWHRHFLVWGVTEEQLAKHLAKIKSRFAPIMPGLCAVHKKNSSNPINSRTNFGTFSNRPVKNIPSASVVSATEKPERLDSSKIPEKSAL